MTPSAAMRYQAKMHPEHTAFMIGADTWTYRRLQTEVRRLAGGLAARGVRAGDRIVLHMSNCAEMLVAYYACFELGAVAAPLRTAYKAAELMPIMKRLQPSVYIGDANLYGEISDQLLSHFPAIDCFTINGEVKGQTISWAALSSMTEAGLSLPDVDAPAVLISTSGTTGEPRLVVHSQSTLSAISESWKSHGFGAQQIAVVALPLAHAGGLFLSTFCIQEGWPFILLHRFDADFVLDAIDQRRATLFRGMPAMYAAMLERQLAKPRAIKSLRICLVAGDATPAGLQEKFLETFGVALRNIWGSTETSGSLAHGLEPGPVCRVLERTSFRLIKGDGTTAQRGEIGELILRGPNIALGYWGAPGVIEDALSDGWFWTGDLMREDEAGALWFVARKKDLIIRGGTNISPIEVERALVASHAAIQEAAVFGVPDAMFGQRVIGFIVLAAGVAKDIRKDVLASLSRQLADYKVPERLEIVDSLPRNTLGKIDRSKLAGMLSESRRHPVNPDKPQDRPSERHPQ